MASYFDQWHFNEDAPLSSSVELKLSSADTLQRRHMAERLASLIGKKPLAKSAEQSASSFTVAVYGSWGAGKTSLKNLTLRFLENYQSVHIVHFNPRQWNNEADIISSFFVQLAEGVELEKGKKAKEGGKTLRRIGSIFTVGQKTAAAGSLATAAIPGMQLASPGLVAAGAGFGIASEVAKAQADSQEKAKMLSLAELQEQAAKQLYSLKKHVTVFVDDIDRLTGPEIALVFQLLKFNADFPNVVYVLLADRVILERGLDTLYPGEGRRYLEKFVQLSLDLPEPPLDALAREFDKVLSPICEELNSISPNLRNEARSAYTDISSPYLSTMRRVQLYVNALHFSLPLGREPGKNTWEVSPFDVLLLELLRAHEPAVFREIRNNKEWLTSIFSSNASARMVFNIKKDNITNNNAWSPEEKEKRIAEMFEQEKPIELSFLEKILAVADKPLVAEKILRQLFPNLDLLFEQRKKTNEIVTGNTPTGAKWDIEKRLCSPRRFNRYFSSVVSGETLKQSERDNLAAQSGESDKLLQKIRELSHNNRTDDVLTELENIVENLNVQEVEPFIISIMNWGDEMPIVPSHMTLSHNPTRILRLCGLITTCLNKTDNLQEAIDTFERACTITTGFYVPLVCAQNNLSIGVNGPNAYLILELSDTPPEEKEQTFERLTAQISQVKADLWKKFDIMINSTDTNIIALEKRSTFGLLLWQWIYRDALRTGDLPDTSPLAELETPLSWTSQEEARKWVADLIKTPYGFARFAQMAAASVDSIWRDEVPYPNIRQFFRTDVIDKTTSAEDLFEVGRKLDFSALNDLERKWANTLLDAVRSKIERKNQSIPYFIWGDSTLA